MQFQNRIQWRSPWTWIPTLYISEGLPYFAVNTLTVLMYVNLGISVADMAFFTGWLYLPWVIKPFWSPFVDLISTKRSWIIAMEAFLAISMACVGFLLPTSHFFASTIVCFWLMAFFSATHDIAADGFYMLDLSPHDQAAFVGVRSTFYRIASVIGQGGLVMLAGHLEKNMPSLPAAWATVFIILSIAFATITVWHTIILPRPATDKPRAGVSASNIIADFGQTFATFFRKKGILPALCFMLLYRLPEAFCIKLVQPFMVAPHSAGGLALSTAEVGFVNGTVGVIALLAGGIAGGLAISRLGLRSCLWPMALALTLPCGLYCVLSMTLPTDFTWICTAVAVEQFGYGFGFSSFMLYLIYFSRGKSATSHYAFCTAFMALGMMLPGMAAGWIHDRLALLNVFGHSGPQGFVNFFWWVMICCLATFAATAMIKVDKGFGKKTE